ncbi:hypothetical protein [Desulfotignum balticum]|uniref:hypothetical protein n=1 Tax=Desulfotignum balticum TaxID=115781 RepID=UPI0003FABBB0|nr:hypothetical protein [Desulfotignum balticum]
MTIDETVKIAGIGRTGARVIRHIKQAEWKCDLLAKIDPVIFLEDDTKSGEFDRNGTFPIRHADNDVIFDTLHRHFNNALISFFITESTQDDIAAVEDVLDSLSGLSNPCMLSVIIFIEYKEAPSKAGGLNSSIRRLTTRPDTVVIFLEVENARVVHECALDAVFDIIAFTDFFEIRYSMVNNSLGDLREALPGGRTGFVFTEHSKGDNTASGIAGRLMKNKRFRQMGPVSDRAVMTIACSTGLYSTPADEVFKDLSNAHDILSHDTCLDHANIYYQIYEDENLLKGARITIVLVGAEVLPGSGGAGNQ